MTESLKTSSCNSDNEPEFNMPSELVRFLTRAIRKMKRKPETLKGRISGNHSIDSCNRRHLPQ
jgi:hypothetical protein